jgi:hypothetical protein
MVSPRHATTRGGKAGSEDCRVPSARRFSRGDGILRDSRTALVKDEFSAGALDHGALSQEPPRLCDSKAGDLRLSADCRLNSVSCFRIAYVSVLVGDETCMFCAPF